MFDKNSFGVRENNIKFILKKNKGQIGIYNLYNNLKEGGLIKNSIIKIKMKCLYDACNILNKNPFFDGLKQNKTFNSNHPDKFKHIEKY